MIKKLAEKFDRSNLLNYRLWQFSLLNVFRFFPWYFLFRIMIFHPNKSIKGLLHYRHLVRKNQKQPLNGTAELQEMKNNFTGNNLLIAPGFCLKPLHPVTKKCLCPAGHANHDCTILSNSEKFLNDQNPWPKQCESCTIGSFIKLAAPLGARFYIMTSAYDIARDVYLPAIKSKQSTYGVFTLCSYSTEAFTFGLAVSGIKGAMFTFCEGDCENHEEWTEADVGIKDKQTKLDGKSLKSLYTFLSELKENKNIQTPTYTQLLNVYSVK
jgi:hypothetical protein